MDGTIFHRLGLVFCSMAKINFRSSVTRKESVLVFAAVAGIFLLLFGPALQAEFYAIEDHVLFRRGPSAISDWITRVMGDMQHFGRFRPVYWLYVAVGYLLFGTTHPHLWHAAQILCGVLTCYLFYVALRRLGADIASSFIFVLLVVCGAQNWIWLNLVPAETIGMLLTALAVYAITLASQRSEVGRWDVLALIAMALAGFAKESFVILIPALLLLRWTCQNYFIGPSWRKSLSGLRVPLTTGALIFVIEMAIVTAVLLSRPGSYGANIVGLSASSFDPRWWWLNIVSTLTLDKQILLAVGVFLWGGLWLGNKIGRAYVLASAVIFAAWLVPQVVLYSNGLNERFLFPAIVSVAAAITLGLSILLRQRHLWALWIIGILLLLPNLANGVESTIKTVGAFTAETVAVNRLVKFLAQNVPADQTILMAGDSGTVYGFEATYSLPVYSKMAGSNSPFYIFPIVSKGQRSAMHIAASKNNTALRYPDALLPSDVGAIIIIDKWIPAFDSKPLVRWLGDTAWREINFTEPYYSFSFRKLGYLKAGEVTHKLLLSASSSGIPSDKSLIVVDHSLARVVNAGQWLDPPPWGIEHNYAGPGSFVWLGQGDKEGLGGVLSSIREQSVNIDLEVVPGPSRADYRRTVEFSLDNGAGQQTQREVFEGGQWKFNVKLQPGANHFRLRVLDEATVSIQPNGDTRRLLALLRCMKVSMPRTRP